MAVIGVLASAGFIATLFGTWVRFETTFGQRDLRAITTDEGRLALVLCGVAIACFVLVRFVRGAVLMIPALLAGAVSTGIAIAAAMDPIATVERSGVIAGAAEPTLLTFAAIASGLLTTASAFAVGWDARRL
jgi:hypothetical protein